MKTTNVGRSRGTFAFLENVAPNLYRHRENLSYWGVKKSNSRRVVHALDTKDRITANGKLREWLDGLAETDPGNRDMNLAMLLEKYAAARTDISASTKLGESGRIAKFKQLFPRPMDTLVARIHNSDIAAWLGQVGAGKRASTRNQFRAFVRALFDFAVADNVIPKNPFDAKINRKAKKDPVIRRIPSPEEFDSLMAEIRKPTWKKLEGQHGGQRPLFQHESADFAEFLGLAGVGQAEAIGLHWEDIDEARGSIHYRRQKTKKAFNTPIFGWLKPLISSLRAQT